MRTAFSLLLLLALSGCTTADGVGSDDTDGPELQGSETVTTSWDVDLFSLYESPTLQTFDTLEGLRQLDRMTIDIDHSAEITLSLENGSSFALEADDYEYQFYFNTLTQLGEEEQTDVDPDDIPEDTNDGPPFFGPGSFGARLSVALDAGDGDPLSGNDQYVETLAESIEFSADYDPVETPRYLEALTDAGEIKVIVGGFTEGWVDWYEDHDGDALIFAGPSGILYEGTMSVTYHFSPTP